MPDVNDRLEGARSNFGCKKPVRAAASSNLTLSGLQTVDGVALAAEERVLAYGQTDSAENGIYSASTGAWARTKDFDGTSDWCRGTLIPVASGTVNAGKIFRVTSADPEDVGETDITFSSISFADAHSNGSVVVSATVNLTAIDADAVDVTGGGATITAITLTEGLTRIVRFTGANTLTHSATLVLPGALNITTAAGDFMIVRGYSSSTVRVVSYLRGDSAPLITGDTSVITGATTDLGSVREQSVALSGSSTITSFGSAAPIGSIKFCRVSGTPIIVNGAAISCPGERNIQCADGDTFIARHSATPGNWRILNYTRAAFEPHTDTTATATATTAESDLLSYSLPAGRLASSGAGIRIRAWGTGTTASTAVTRRVRLYFGATVVADSGAVNVPVSWQLEATVLRTSAAGTQEAIGNVLASTGGVGSVTYARAAPAETLSAAVTVKVTGLCTASTGVLTQTGFVVEQLSL
jgi:hypothetical protein